FEAYSLNVNRLLPNIGHIKLGALSPEHVQAAYGALLQIGLSARSVEQAHAVLHRALAVALKWGLVGRNVCEAVSPPRPTHKEMKTLSEPDVRTLLQATNDDRDAALWTLLVTTGVRLGEALGLRWDDLDVTGGTLTIR